MFSHLLVPIDGTSAGLEAVDAAIAIARLCKARIHLLHVIPSFPAIAYLAERVHATRELFEQEAGARAILWLGEARERVLGAGVPCEGSYTFAPHLHEAIADTARDYGCDLIVMASPLRGGLPQSLFTREAQAVMQASDVPVLAWR
jgi:nucleotide-binding universal stress UspA family protein